MGNNAIVHKLDSDRRPRAAAGRTQSSDDLAAVAAAAAGGRSCRTRSMNGSGRHSWPGNLNWQAPRSAAGPVAVGGGSGAERFKRVVDGGKRGRNRARGATEAEARVLGQKMRMLNPNSEVEVAKRSSA